MKKLCHKPVIVDLTDRWSVAEGLKVAYYEPFYLPDDEFYRRLERFAHFNKENATAEDLERLLKETGAQHGTIWEFNALRHPDEDRPEEDKEYVRQFVARGNKDMLREWNWTVGVKYYILDKLCSVYNFYSRRWGANKKYKEWIKARY